MIQSLAVTGAALSLFLLTVLAVRRSRRPADGWLAAWIGAQGVFCLGVLAGLSASPRLALVALVAGQFAMVAAGPTHYLYAASVLGAPHRFARHIGVVLAGAAVPTGLLLWAPVRVEAGALVVDMTTAWLAALPLLGVAVATWYPLATLRLIAHRSTATADTSGPALALYGWLRLWAVTILGINAGLLLAFVAATLTSWPVHVHMVVIMGLQVVQIAYVGQQGLTRPGVFVESAEAVPSRGRPRPQPRQAIGDYTQFEALIARDKPHLLPELTAETLAAQLGWAPERLTDALRYGAETNFFDAINAARVWELQALARAPANAHVSLLVLAHEAGFGSKTAFYDAFRRHAGCTPAAWRKRQSPLHACGVA